MPTIWLHEYGGGWSGITLLLTWQLCFDQFPEHLSTFVRIPCTIDHQLSLSNHEPSILRHEPFTNRHSLSYTTNNHDYWPSCRILEPVIVNDVPWPTLRSQNHRPSAMKTNCRPSWPLTNHFPAMRMQESGSRLVFSNKGDFFPDTQLRVLGVPGLQRAIVEAANSIVIHGG